MRNLFIAFLLIITSTANAQFSGYLGKTKLVGITAEVTPMSNVLINNLNTNFPDTTASKVYTSIGLTFEKLISNHSTMEVILRTSSYTGKFSNIESYGLRQPILPNLFYVDSLHFINSSFYDTAATFNSRGFQYDEKYYFVARNLELAVNFKLFGDLLAPVGGYTLVGFYANNTTYTPHDSTGYKFYMSDWVYNLNRDAYGYYNEKLSTTNLGARIGLGTQQLIGNSLVLDVAATFGAHVQLLSTNTLKQVSNNQEAATFGSYLSNDMYMAALKRSAFNFRVGLKYML